MPWAWRNRQPFRQMARVWRLWPKVVGRSRSGCDCWLAARRLLSQRMQSIITARDGRPIQQASSIIRRQVNALGPGDLSHDGKTLAFFRFANGTRQLATADRDFTGSRTVVTLDHNAM